MMQVVGMVEIVDKLLAEFHIHVFQQHLVCPVFLLLVFLLKILQVLHHGKHVSASSLIRFLSRFQSIQGVFSGKINEFDSLLVIHYKTCNTCETIL